MRLSQERADDLTPTGGLRPWPRCLVLVFGAGVIFYGVYSVAKDTSVTMSPARRRLYYASASTSCHCESSDGSSLQRDNDRLFYNRVPKCGSTTLYTLIRKLSSLHGYVHFNSKVYDRKNVDEEEQRRIVQLVRSTPPPCSFDRHVFFINFTRFGATPPVYINIIREPVERIISSFFYRRMAAKLNNKTSRVRPSAYWLNKKFEHCVLTPDPECTFIEGHNYSVLQLPYFCGQEPHCQLLNDPSALEQAKRNIEESYAVVGVLEQMNITLQVLEAKLPRFFGGAFKIYHSLGVHRNRNLNKEHVSEEVKDLLKANLTAEYELYHFVLQRLYNQHRQLQTARNEDDHHHYHRDLEDAFYH